MPIGANAFPKTTSKTTTIPETLFDKTFRRNASSYNGLQRQPHRPPKKLDPLFTRPFLAYLLEYHDLDPNIFCPNLKE